MNIAISGKMCSGKTTLAKILRDKFNYTILSFASPIKKLVSNMQLSSNERIAQIHNFCVCLWGEELGCNIFKWAINTLLEPNVEFEFNDKNNKGRKILQDIEDEARERFGEDVWLIPMKKAIEKNNKNVVIDNARYPNELEFCKKNRFITVRLEVPKQIRFHRIHKLYGEIQDDQINHPSEIMLDSVNPDLIFDVVCWCKHEKPIEIIQKIKRNIEELYSTTKAIRQ